MSPISNKTISKYFATYNIFQPPYLSDTMTEIFIELIHPKAKIPKKATQDSAGYDLYAIERTTLIHGQPTKVRTGLKLRFPENYYGRIADRSSMVLNHFILTRAGVIDRDYGGEVMVLLVSANTVPYEIQEGDRIAQLIIEKHTNQAVFVNVTGRVPRNLREHFDDESERVRCRKRTTNDETVHTVATGMIEIREDGAPIMVNFTPEMMRVLAASSARRGGFGSTGK